MSQTVWHVPGSAHVHRYRDCATSGPWHKYEPVELEVPEIAPDLVPRSWRVCLLYEGDPLLICVPCEERYRSERLGMPVNPNHPLCACGHSVFMHAVTSGECDECDEPPCPDFRADRQSQVLSQLAEAERAANQLRVVDVHGDLGVLGDDGVVRPWSVKRS